MQLGQERREQEPQCPASELRPVLAVPGASWGSCSREVIPGRSRQPVGNTVCVPKAMGLACVGQGWPPRSRGRCSISSCCPHSHLTPSLITHLRSFGKYLFEALLCV